ncbi:MAG: MOSC domain-containing protein [Steroidobacteraceae bacterium]
MNSAKICGLYIYPLKSCRGISLDTASVQATGLANDRRWMLVNDQGRFLTQRELPKMALIVPALSGQGMVIEAPGMPLLSVSGVMSDGVVDVTIWKDTCRAISEGEQAAAWFSEFLGVSTRLVRFDDTQTRLSSHDWTGEIDAANQFSDGFAMLTISEASLADLNARMDIPLPMNRFRPNLVLQGLDAYAEDGIHELVAGDLHLRVVKPSTRCKITTIDQLTGVSQGSEPLASLMKYRRNPQLRGVTFGQNLIISTGVGTSLQVGQTLQVTYQA